ncbi:unnamed protein product [Thelazia callipaeda]|uniref:Nuclear receptor domain-containing protein n=1 Tax=Thelazia callipaeda TaxID=103827 RepID=A0A3P7NDY7_THECL|nr:unnamed protein product [Thelazia callipaeda]
MVKKLCKICKRKATGRHYGVESCEACKCFFRRVAKSRVKYYCQNGGSCKIDLDKRSSCQACRFNLCIDAGMTFLRK